MTTLTTLHPTVEELRAIEIFHDLSDSDLQWLAAHMHDS